MVESVGVEEEEVDWNRGEEESAIRFIGCRSDCRDLCIFVTLCIYLLAWSESVEEGWNGRERERGRNLSYSSSLLHSHNLR